MNMLKSMSGSDVVKFVALYEKKWLTKLSGNIISGGKTNSVGPLDLCLNVSVGNYSTLNGYIFVPKGINFIYEENQYKKEVLEYLANHLGNKARNPLIYKEQFLSANKFTGNCPMACPNLGNMENLDLIRKPIGRLFWAGAETATLWYGFMGGAAQSGYRAAMEVLYECRPSAISFEDFTFLTPRRRIAHVYPQTLSARFFTSKFLRKFVIVPIVVIMCYLTHKLKKIMNLKKPTML